MIHLFSLEHHEKSLFVHFAHTALGPKYRLRFDFSGKLKIS